MGAKISSATFKKSFAEQNAAQGIDAEKMNEYMGKFYGEAPAYSAKTPYDMYKIRTQVERVCNHMAALGLQNFFGLVNKFNGDPKTMGAQIKETMEAILYQIENSAIPPKDLAAQYKDRAFVCEEGTLTNLQGILAEMSLGTQGIDAYIIEQKKQLVTQTATDMYNKGQFIDFPWAFRQYKPMEIHNVTSLVNSVAPEYGLKVKTKAEDKHIREVFSDSRRKLSNTLENQLQNEDVVNAFIDGVAMNVAINLPLYEVGKYANPNEFNQEVLGALETLRLKIDLPALIEMENYEPKGYKANMQSIVRDAVTIHLHENGVIQHPEINLVKLRINIESSQDMEGNSRITTDVLEQAKDQGYLEQATKYMMDNKLKLDADEFPTQDIVKYAIDNNIKIEGQDPKQYALASIIEEYLKTPDPKIKQELNTRYKDVHQMGAEKTTELLSVDSNLGKFLDNEKSIKTIANHKAARGKSVLQDMDFTKCDLALVEKCMNAQEKAQKEKPRNYDKFTTAQKVGMAFSALLGTIGPVITYFSIKSHNASEKQALEKELGQSLQGIQQDLNKISKISRPIPTEEAAPKQAKPSSPTKQGFLTHWRDKITGAKQSQQQDVTSTRG